jgi:hypothetical protein
VYHQQVAGDYTLGKCTLTSIDINTSLVALQAMATVTAGQEISIWWYVDSGAVVLGNRILTLVNVN